MYTWVCEFAICLRIFPVLLAWLLRGIITDLHKRTLMGKFLSGILLEYQYKIWFLLVSILLPNPPLPWDEEREQLQILCQCCSVKLLWVCHITFVVILELSYVWYSGTNVRFIFDCFILGVASWLLGHIKPNVAKKRVRSRTDVYRAFHIPDFIPVLHGLHWVGLTEEEQNNIRSEPHRSKCYMLALRLIQEWKGWKGGRL